MTYQIDTKWRATRSSLIEQGRDAHLRLRGEYRKLRARAAFERYLPYASAHMLRDIGLADRGSAGLRRWRTTTRKTAKPYRYQVR